MHSEPETPLFFRARRIGDGQTFESFRRFYFRIFGGNLICPSLTLPARKVQKIPVPIYASHRRILRFPVFSCQTHRPRTTRELPARKVQKIPVPIYASHRRILRFPVFSCQTHRPRTTREQANCSPHLHDSHAPHTTPIPQPTSTVASAILPFPSLPRYPPGNKLINQW